MFYNCKSLKSISDLSKWNTSNVTKKSNIFFKCDSLSSKPEIHTKKNENSFRNDIKIIVIGTSDTNKTGYVNKYTKNYFNDTYKATIVSEFGFKIYEYGDNLYRVQLWDLAGQDKNAMVTRIFAKNAHGVVVMSNAVNVLSRENTIKWKSSVDDVAKFSDGKELPCILVENNIELLCDDEHDDPSLEENSNGINNYSLGNEDNIMTENEKQENKKCILF
jgi:small GTP-binding protein